MADKVEPEPRPSGGSVPPGWSQNQPPPAWSSPQSGWTSGGPEWTSPEAGTGASSPRGWGDQGTGTVPPGWAQPPRTGPDVKPGVIPLRPLGVGEILDGAISTIRDHPRVTLSISAVVAILSALLNGFANWVLLGDLESLDPATATDDEILEVAAIGLTATGAGLLVISLATVVATGVLTVVIGRAVLGQSLSLGEAWAASRPRLLRLVGLWILSILLVFGVVVVGFVPGIVLAAAGLEGLGVALLVLGGLAGVLGGIHVYVRLALAPPALMLEKQRTIAAMRRSARLVKGSWWRVFWILLLAFVLAGILSQIIQTPFGILGYGPGAYFGTAEVSAPSLTDIAVASVGAIIASTITLPFTAGVTTLVYVDRRMRREGLDIELARATRAGAASTDASGDDARP